MLLIVVVFVLSHYMTLRSEFRFDAEANTNNVNMTRALPQTTASKDEPNIVFMWIS
jgi:hypothetical protein